MQSYTLLLVKPFWIRKFIPIFAQFTKKRAMIKENFIKLYENSFRENWDLPCYTDYGEETQYTYGEVAEKIARLHLLFKHCSLRRGDKISVIGKITLIGASPIWQLLHTERSLSLSFKILRLMTFIISSIIPNLYSYSPATAFGRIWKRKN